MIRVKDLIAGHDRNQVFRIRQVDDIVRPARDHMNCFDLIAGNLKLHHFARIDVPLLDQSMTRHHDEQLPLTVVPVLALGDAGATDVDGDLPAVCRMNQLGKGAAVVRVHLEGVANDFVKEITPPLAVP